MRIIYSKAEWCLLLWHSVRDAALNILRIGWSLVAGIASVIHYVYREVNAFYGRELRAGIVIAVIIAFLTAGWIATFVSERKARMDAEMSRDVLTLRLDSARHNTMVKEQAFLHMMESGDDTQD